MNSFVLPSLRVGTDETLLAKFNKHHSGNAFYEKPPTKESAFSVIHYAGKVKYQIKVLHLLLAFIYTYPSLAMMDEKFLKGHVTRFVSDTERHIKIFVNLQYILQVV